jgi:hypothetical protein
MHLLATASSGGDGPGTVVSIVALVIAAISLAIAGLSYRVSQRQQQQTDAAAARLADDRQLRNELGAQVRALGRLIDESDWRTETDARGFGEDLLTCQTKINSLLGGHRDAAALLAHFQSRDHTNDLGRRAREMREDLFELMNKLAFHGP